VCKPIWQRERERERERERDFDDVSLESSCGSSSFYESENATEKRMNDVQPFRFEPSKSASESDNIDTENESIRTDHLGNINCYVFKR
jgi:hypothetical protein